MQYISAKTQRKIMFVPVLNLLTIFICLSNTLRMQVSRKVSMQIFPYLLRYAVLPGILWVLVVGLIPKVATVIYPIVMYAWPMCVSYGLIKYQEKYLEPMQS